MSSLVIQLFDANALKLTLMGDSDGDNDQNVPYTLSPLDSHRGSPPSAFSIGRTHQKRRYKVRDGAKNAQKGKVRAGVHAG